MAVSKKNFELGSVTPLRLAIFEGIDSRNFIIDTPHGSILMNYYYFCLESKNKKIDIDCVNMP